MDDIEKPGLAAAEGFADRLHGQPLAVRLGDLWSDLVRVSPDTDAAVPPRPAAAVPLLDDMKGILQWD
ncbi:MAG TPA: hypothetical protein VHL12_02110 [Gemmatimonadaceae bacterium]|nr:hypothetical protein [Gemmatimonadaceae bacterium]